MDFYSNQAKQLGLRSRANFKINDINEKFKILKGKCLEIGSYPGGWTEVALEHCKSVIAFDVKKYSPIGNETLFHGNVFDQEFISEKISPLGWYNVIISDAAPNITGIKEADHQNFIDLIEAIIDIVENNISGGGNCVIKVFNYNEVISMIKKFGRKFKKHYIYKPTGSKKHSSEHYFIGLKFHR